MYRKNTAGQHLGFCLVKASDGTALTGASVTARRSIDGAAQASATGSVTELGNGQYDFAPSQADTNGNQVSFLFTASTAVPVEKTIVTTACDPTAASFGLVLAKTTNVTGFNDITAAAAANGILDAVITSHTTANTAGKVFNDLYGLTPTSTVAADLQTIQGHTVTCSGGVTIPAATLASTTNITGGTITTVSGNVAGSVASVTAPVTLNLSQTGLSPRDLGSVADASLTVGDALVCAIASAAGKENVSSSTYVVKTPSTGTVIRTFTLDSSTNPTSRT